MKSNETDVLNKAYDFIAKEFYAENSNPMPRVSKT